MARYFVIEATADGPRVYVHDSKKKLLEWFKENYLDDECELPEELRVESTQYEKLPKLDIQYRRGILIVKGDVVSLRPKTIVKTLDID